MKKERPVLRDRPLGWGAAAGAALALALAAPASAKQFQMSGTWLMRKGEAFFPLQFGGNNGGTQRTHASMGSWTEAPFYPNRTAGGAMSPLAQVVKDDGVVATNGFVNGVNPGTLMVPQGFFQQDQKVAIPLSGVNRIQITTMLQIDAPFSAATFAPGGGPGSFTWCPLTPACTKLAALATMAGLNTMTRGNHSRVIYATGANQFGGTMQMGVRFGGLVSAPVNAAPLRVGHAIIFGSGATLRRLAVGGGANDAPRSTSRTWLAAT